MTNKRKEAIVALLKGIETGDPESVSVVNQEKYIQHNPQTQEGGEGLEVLFKRLSLTSPKVNIVRIFSDGDFVFGHTEYDFSTRRIGFEVFRFEGDRAVEHWDNIQARKGPNAQGRSMVDGPVEVLNDELTEDNRAHVRLFIEEVLIAKNVSKIPSFVHETYAEHNPVMVDGIDSLTEALGALGDDAKHKVDYRCLHRLLADGNFVLSVCEGEKEGVHTSYYDLFRIENGLIVEHWDTVEKVPPKSEWKNDNGKF